MEAPLPEVKMVTPPDSDIAEKAILVIAKGC